MALTLGTFPADGPGSSPDSERVVANIGDYDLSADDPYQIPDEGEWALVQRFIPEEDPYQIPDEGEWALVSPSTN